MSQGCVSGIVDKQGRVSRLLCDTTFYLSLHQAIFLFFAAVLGGALNAVAGGGSFISFPSLLFTGVPPIPANATNTVALWTGINASGGAYRRRLNVPPRVVAPLATTSLMGGLCGAFLLLRTPAHTFMRVLPWLLLGATLLFLFGRRLAGQGKSRIGHAATPAAIAAAAVCQFFIAVYGGYFGGGMGIVILAMLSAAGMADIHAMNALKSILSSAVNGIAVIAFIVARAVYWPQGLVMIGGAIVGGYFGAHYAMRLPGAWIRRFVILIGAGMTVYFFWKAYGV
jgi:uncharacterized membrane protein YfcA